MPVIIIDYYAAAGSNNSPHYILYVLSLIFGSEYDLVFVLQKWRGNVYLSRTTRKCRLDFV